MDNASVQIALSLRRNTPIFYPNEYSNCGVIVDVLATHRLRLLAYYDCDYWRTMLAFYWVYRILPFKKGNVAAVLGTARRSDSYMVMGPTEAKIQPCLRHTYVHRYTIHLVHSLGFFTVNSFQVSASCFSSYTLKTN